MTHLHPNRDSRTPEMEWTFSGVTDESPFSSKLTTPIDEVPAPASHHEKGPREVVGIKNTDLSLDDSEAGGHAVLGQRQSTLPEHLQQPPLNRDLSLGYFKPRVGTQLKGSGESLDRGGEKATKGAPAASCSPDTDTEPSTSPSDSLLPEEGQSPPGSRVMYSLPNSRFVNDNSTGGLPFDPNWALVEGSRAIQLQPAVKQTAPNRRDDQQREDGETFNTAEPSPQVGPSRLLDDLSVALDVPALSLPWTAGASLSFPALLMKILCNPSDSTRLLLRSVIRVLLFIPWCAVVGAALALAPDLVTTTLFVTFPDVLISKNPWPSPTTSGSPTSPTRSYWPESYLFLSPDQFPTDMHLFAHILDCGFQHVASFVAIICMIFLGLLKWNGVLGLELGLLIATCLLFRAWQVWVGYTTRQGWIPEKVDEDSPGNGVGKVIFGRRRKEAPLKQLEEKQLMYFAWKVWLGGVGELEKIKAFGTGQFAIDIDADSEILSWFADSSDFAMEEDQKEA